MVLGNSSSGIVEAASFKIPAVNIGTRQDGKFKPRNVIDAKYDWKDIYKKILKAKSRSFNNSIKNIHNPYEENISTKNLVKIILKLKNTDKLLIKKFVKIKK